MEWGWDNARALIGIAVIYGIAWGLSENRKLFSWRLVLGATAGLGLLICPSPVGGAAGTAAAGVLPEVGGAIAALTGSV